MGITRLICGCFSFSPSIFFLLNQYFITAKLYSLDDGDPNMFFRIISSVMLHKIC